MAISTWIHQRCGQIFCPFQSWLPFSRHSFVLNILHSLKWTDKHLDIFSTCFLLPFNDFFPQQRSKNHHLVSIHPAKTKHLAFFKYTTGPTPILQCLFPFPVHSLQVQHPQQHEPRPFRLKCHPPTNQDDNGKTTMNED